MKIKYISFIVTLSVTFLGAIEISAFDAGNTNIASPYGLTRNEEQLYRSTQKVDNLENNFDALNQRLDGLNLVIESQNNKIVSLKNEIMRIDLNKTMELNARDREIQSLKEKINELSKKVNNGKNSAATSKISQAPKTATVKAVDNFSDKSNATIESEANKLYGEKKYAQAKSRFEYLISKNYKPARSYFMLGESEYFSQNYAKAISNYEKSVRITDKADYMPKLLYHTAISFDKIKQTANANKFYAALKQEYPNSPEAKASPNR